MTRVSYETGNHCMTMDGHAGAGEYGHDIVCAAASILMHTLEATVMDNQTVLQPSVSKRKGYARIQCEPTKRNKRRCEDIYRTIFRGYELLAQQYPEHVTAYTI